MEQTRIVTNQQSNLIYKAAGVMAILIVLAGLTDALTSLGIEAQDNRTVHIVEWFTLFQTRPFEAFSRLGIINMITLSCGVPITLAFIHAFQKGRPELASNALVPNLLVPFASILFFIGTAVYLSSNTVFALFAVGQQYAAAAAAQKPMLEAAGQALLAQGADLTPGTFIGLFFTQIAGLLTAGAMLRGNIFSKWTGRTGLTGYGLMVVFFILTAFFPAQYDLAMIVAAPGGLVLIAYEILLAQSFFRLDSKEGYNNE